MMVVMMMMTVMVVMVDFFVWENDRELLLCLGFMGVCFGGFISRALLWWVCLVSLFGGGCFVVYFGVLFYFACVGLECLWIILALICFAFHLTCFHLFILMVVSDTTLLRRYF